MNYSATKQPHALQHIPFNTTPSDTHALWRSQHAIHEMHNLLINHANKLLHVLDNNKTYRQALHTYGRVKDKLEHSNPTKKEQRKLAKIKRDTAQLMNDTRKEIGLTEHALQAWINEHRKRKYAKIANADAVQKEATRVWKGIEKILFSNGETLHYQRWDNQHSIGSKKDGSHVSLVRDDNDIPVGIKWQKRIIPFKRALTDYELAALEYSEVRYTDITFDMFPDGWHYYANISPYGLVPIRGTQGTGDGGLDPGPSTMAYSTEEEVAQVLLAPDAVKYNEQIADLDRRIDQSKRATNPDYYNADGTYKKRAPGEKRHWVLSNHCKYLKKKRQMVYRKKTENTTQQHTVLANRIVSQCDTLYTEPMNWAGLAKRAKKHKDEHGKWKRRKRWGKSIADHAPGTFMSILEWKCLLYGVRFVEVDSYRFRGSQLNHVTGEFEKCPLSQRSKMIGDDKAQRDMYTSLLLRSSKLDGSGCDVDLVRERFGAWLVLQNAFIADAIARDIPRNSCFGF